MSLDIRNPVYQVGSVQGQEEVVRPRELTGPHVPTGHTAGGWMPKTVNRPIPARPEQGSGNAEHPFTYPRGDHGEHGRRFTHDVRIVCGDRTVDGEHR